METRANYILIGLFTLAGAFGMLAFFLWFAQIELDRQFAYYDIRFSSVSGLSNASDVRFSGLPVGQVVSVRLSPDKDGTIKVRVEVAANTPVRTDSIATIESQGVTGVSFVSIDPGSPDAPLLVPSQPGEIPEIQAGRSVLQSLTEDAPRLLDETLRIVTELGNMLNDENQARITRIIDNVETASDEFAQTLKDFSSVTGAVSGFAEQIDRFNTTLDTLTSDLSKVLQSADTTIVSIGELSEQAKGFVGSGTEVLTAAQGTITQADRFIQEDLTLTTREFKDAANDLRAQVVALREDASALMATFGETGETATARLTEAEATLAGIDKLIGQLDSTIATVDSAAASFDTLLTEEGKPLVSETRVAVAEATDTIRRISEVAETDLPGIVEDIRTATETASRVITEVGSDLSSASGRVDGVMAKAETALSDVTETFANANETLSAINAAMETADGMLTAAESAFQGADRVINEDFAGISADLRATLDKLNGAIAQVSQEIPGITEDLRAASRSGQAAFAQLEQVIAASGPPITTFATTGLPLITRLTEETRRLIVNLDRLTQQIQRDPARFFLGNQSPEFRRR